MLQCALFVSGMWGVFCFQEIKGTTRTLKHTNTNSHRSPPNVDPNETIECAGNAVKVFFASGGVLLAGAEKPNFKTVFDSNSTLILAPNPNPNPKPTP